MSEISPVLLDALGECARYVDRGLCYWWRSASMEKLAALGLVETWTPPSVAERKRLKARPYRPTQAGRARLSNPGAKDV